MASEVLETEFAMKLETTMHRRNFLKYVVGAAAFCPTCFSVASALAAEKDAAKGAAKGAAKVYGAPHWSYGGEDGPDKWGELSPANRVCDLGVQQSPIDLTRSIRADLNDIEVRYGETAVRVLNNGHTIQANCDPDSSGNYVAPMLTWSVITDKVQAEADTARQEQMIDQMPVNVMFLDPTDFTITYMNETSRQTLQPLQSLLPCPIDKIVGQTVDIFHKNPAH